MKMKEALRKVRKGLRCSYCGKTHKPTQLQKCTACSAVVCEDSLIVGVDEYGVELRWHERYEDSQNGPTIQCGPCFLFDPTDPEIFEAHQRLATQHRKLAIKEMLERAERENAERERDAMLRKYPPIASPPPPESFPKQWPGVGLPGPGERWTTGPTNVPLPQPGGTGDNIGSDGISNTGDGLGGKGSTTKAMTFEERVNRKLKKAFPDAAVPEEIQEQWMEIVRKVELSDE